MWGIIPAAGTGSRIQPLAFSKELLPVGSYLEGSSERPRAVSEYLVERMVKAGVDKICFVISPGKADILNYFGAHALSANIFYAVQPQPAGLCDALFRALPLIHPDEQVCIGLPDTIWFPETALADLPDGRLSFLLFPVKHPDRFDAVVTRRRRRSARSSGKKPDRFYALDLGRPEDAGFNVQSPSLSLAAPKRRIPGHVDQCLHERGRTCLWTTRAAKRMWTSVR